MEHYSLHSSLLLTRAHKDDVGNRAHLGRIHYLYLDRDLCVLLGRRRPETKHSDRKYVDCFMDNVATSL